MSEPAARARRYRRQPRDEADRELHARLVNWARTYRTSHGPSDDAGLTPDELDAAVLEVAMCRLRKMREPQYLALWQVFMGRRNDMIGADHCRCSVAEYKRRVRRGLDFLHGNLDGARRVS